MRDIPEKDQIPSTRGGELYIKHLKSHIRTRNELLAMAEKRLEDIEIEMGIRKPRVIIQERMSG